MEYKPKASGNGYFPLNIDSEESNFDVFVAWGMCPEMIVETRCHWQNDLPKHRFQLKTRGLIKTSGAWRRY